MVIGNRKFDTVGRCCIMGILNVTPDSFSDGGAWLTRDDALRHAEKMVAEGADIIDVGGESSRPGHTVIPDQQEIDRVIPIVDALRSRIDAPISIDTYKSSVAEAALGAGACLINDIWGFKHDSAMAPLAARTGAVCCLMHNRHDMEYADLMADILNDLNDSVSIALKAGVGKDRIIIDPGIGFAKDYTMNLTVIRELAMLKKLGYPVMLGASRKSVIGTALRLPVTERAEGTLATTVIAVISGCSFVRVHDVMETKRAIMMTEAVMGVESRE